MIMLNQKHYLMQIINVQLIVNFMKLAIRNIVWKIVKIVILITLIYREINVLVIVVK